ncbi:PREDICTED: uncharacterized protein LOC104591501 isoform X2 [Nelumbo nucifera]|uniref:Uncharacterized protein LOC104591501 isoform X2 n=1 Tax=Nelumbo nucifera TaxID=4432 RepID=A0A1U7ZL95_NELNU|nr:PREDICTED: uncharacterized protein LOC104591501 isoform X2 [Nelumbo nucifera]
MIGEDSFLPGLTCSYSQSGNRKKMKSLKLDAFAGIRYSSDSSTRRIWLPVHKTRSLQGNPFLSLSPLSVGSANYSPTAFPYRMVYRSKPSFEIVCFNQLSSMSSDDDDLHPQKDYDSIASDNPCSMPTSCHQVAAARFLQNAAWVGVATIVSKILGLLREVILAAVFGVGPVATAFKHASVLPIFSVSLIGGVNGPLHIAMSTTLSKLSKESGKRLVQTTYFVMLMIGCILGALIFISAELIVYATAPGLWVAAECQITREIAIRQLKLMIPCIVFAGPIGLGYGCLSAEGDNFIPCMSPALSSISIILSCIMYVCMKRSNAYCLDDVVFGGVVVACGASVGAFLQWLIQVIMYEKMGYDFVAISFSNVLKDEVLHEFFMLMLPAILSSSLAQIASFTDLYFASFIPGAAAGLSYAHLLAMAPLGILSSIVILPLLPTFSRLAKCLSWSYLMDDLKRAVLICMIIVLPIASIMIALAEPVTSVLFQRFKSDSSASAMVAPLLLCYSIGLPFCIIRELLVAVFYALGDGEQPFLISVSAIILNGFLDWLFVSRFHLGAQGLALSTSFVTTLSTLVLLQCLLKKLPGLNDSKELVSPLLLLLPCCIVAGSLSSVAHKVLWNFLSSISILRFCRVSAILCISLSALVGMFGFFIPLVILNCVGSKLVKDLSRTLLNR